MTVKVQDIEDIPDLLPACQGKRLVDRKINGMQNEPNHVVPNRWHEPPSRVVCPFHLGSFTLPAYDRSDIARLVQVDRDNVSVLLKKLLVFSERLGNACLGIVKVVEIVTEAFRFRLEQNCRPAGQVGIL